VRASTSMHGVNLRAMPAMVRGRAFRASSLNHSVITWCQRFTPCV
jgi:hypothetical protein